MAIRPADLSELARLAEIERDAGQAFVAVGMGDIAADAPPSEAELAAFVTAGRAWVATADTDTDDGDGVAVAYLLGAIVDGAAHIEQVSAVAAVRGQRLGAQLIDHFAEVAAQEGRPWVTLTTFADVPWNAPYYARLGFSVIAPPTYGPELVALVAHEAARIPGDWPRVAMRRAVAR